MASRSPVRLMAQIPSKAKATCAPREPERSERPGCAVEAILPSRGNRFEVASK